MAFNMAHLHLVLNHVPVIGTVVALGFFVVGLLRRDDAFVRSGFVLLVVIAVLGIGVYFTGEPAEHAVEGVAGVTRERIHEHEEAAEWATITLGIAGAYALWALLDARKRAQPISRKTATIGLVILLFPTLAMARAANLGGEIRHEEARSGWTPPPRPPRSGEAREGQGNPGQP
jgi:uncharacterized membrane protein